MGALYDLSVAISLQTTAFSTGASMVLRLFNSIQHSAGITGSQIDKLGRSLATFAAGAAVTGVGFGLFSFVDKAAKRAGDLETILVGIQNRTRGTIPGGQLVNPQTGQLSTAGAAFTTRLTNIGLGNQMNSIDVGTVARSASLAGITNFNQLQNMLKPLSNYAEVMFSATKADPASSAKIATEFAHLYGAFGDKKIGGVSDTQYLVDQLGKAMQIVPVSQDNFLRLMSQFVGTERPLYKNKGSKALITDTIGEGVLMAQMGQGSRGGNQISRIITNMMGGARGKPAQAAILGIQRGTGIHFADAQGNPNDPNMLLKALATTYQKLSPVAALKEFNTAFAQNGARLAGLFADPVVGSRLKSIATAMKSMPDTAAQQRAYNQSLPGQQVQAQKNWDSAYTNFGLVALPAITKFATAMANATAGLVRFTQQHPVLLKFMATLMLVTAAIALVVGPFLILVGIIGAASVGFEVLGGIVGVIAAVGFAPLLIAVLAIGAAIVGVTLLITHWGEITKVVGSVFSAFGTALYNLTQWIATHIPGMGFMKDKTPPLPKMEAVSVGGMDRMLPYGTKSLAYNTGTADVMLPIHHGKKGYYVDIPGQKPGGTGGGGPVWDMPLVQGHRASVWDMPIVQGRGAHGAAPVYNLHIAPGAVGPIHVHGADHHDEEALAARVGAHVVRDLGDHLVHTLTSGAPSAFGLSPVLGTPAPR